MALLHTFCCNCIIVDAPKSFFNDFQFRFCTCIWWFAHALGISILIYYTYVGFLLYFLLKLFGFCILKVSRFETEVNLLFVGFKLAAKDSCSVTYFCPKLDCVHVLAGSQLWLDAQHINL